MLLDAFALDFGGAIDIAMSLVTFVIIHQGRKRKGINLWLQGSKFIFGFGSTCVTRCKFLGALPKF